MLLPITTSKKAAAIISTFNKREADIYNTGIGYISEDMKHIKECDKEINIFSNPNPAKYHNAINRQTQLTFRAKYLLQCLELSIYDNFENMTIEVKHVNDK